MSDSLPESAHIIDASSLINVRVIAALRNDARFFDALLPPGRLIIPSTVWDEAAGNTDYLGDELLDSWLQVRLESGRLERIETSDFPAGPKDAGDNSIRSVVPLFHNSRDVYVITDDSGLAANSGGATRAMGVSRYITENLINWSITPEQYLNTAMGLAISIGADNLALPFQQYVGSNGVSLEFKAFGLVVTDRAGFEHFILPKDKFKIDDVTGTVTVSRLDMLRCFRAGTYITVAGGDEKTIENIAVGEMVMAYREPIVGFSVPTTDSLIPARVARVFRGTTTEWIEIEGVGEGVTRVTPGHRYLRPDGTFAEIQHILATDGLVIDAAGEVDIANAAQFGVGISTFIGGYIARQIVAANDNSRNIEKAA